MSFMIPDHLILTLINSVQQRSNTDKTINHLIPPKPLDVDIIPSIMKAITIIINIGIIFTPEVSEVLSVAFQV